MNIYLVNGVSTKVHGFKIEPNNLACQKSPSPSHPFLTESPELLSGYSQHILPRLPRCFRGVQTGLCVVRDSIIGYRASKWGFVVESGRVCGACRDQAEAAVPNVFDKLLQKRWVWAALDRCICHEDLLTQTKLANAYAVIGEYIVAQPS